MTATSPVAAAIAVSPDGRWVASVDTQLTLRLWQIDSGKLVHTLSDPDFALSDELLELSPQAYINWSRVFSRTSIAFSPDGCTIASASWGACINFWDVATGRVVGKTDFAMLPPNTLAFDTYGRTIVTGNLLGVVEFREVPAGRKLETIDAHSGAVLCMAISPDGQLCATGSADTTVKLWDIATGRLRRTLGDPRLAFDEVGWNPVVAVSFAREGRLVSVASDGRVRVWQITSEPEEPELFRVALLGPVALSPGADWLACGIGRNILLRKIL